VTRRGFGLLGLLVLMWTAPAAAQDAGRTGLVVLTPGTVGMVWHVSDHVAVRPEVSFLFSAVDVDDSSANESTSGTAGLGVSVPLAIRRWGDATAYVAPRFSYVRATSDSGGPPDLRLESVATSYGVGGSVGLQYLLGERFAIFAETGLSYARSSSGTESDSPAVTLLRKTHSWSLGTRAAIGAGFYF
jgi:hypothetical protein